MRTFIGAVPASVLTLALAVLVASLVSEAIARELRTRRWVAFLFLAGCGLVISATLVPTASALEGQASSGVCDFSRLGLAPTEELLSVNVTSLNVLLFIPLGVAVGLLPPNRPVAIATMMAISLTFVVEAIQLLLPVLGRGCQTADMVDNLLGLAIGAAGGTLVRLLVPRSYLERRRSPAERSESS